MPDERGKVGLLGLGHEVRRELVPVLDRHPVGTADFLPRDLGSAVDSLPGLEVEPTPFANAGLHPTDRRMRTVLVRPVPHEIQECLDRITMVVIRVREDGDQLREAQRSDRQRQTSVGDNLLTLDRLDSGVDIPVAVTSEWEFEVREQHVRHPCVLAAPVSLLQNVEALLGGATHLDIVPLLTEPLDRVVDVMIAIFVDENVHGFSPWFATTSPSREWIFYCTTGLIGLSSTHVQYVAKTILFTSSSLIYNVADENF